MAIVFAKVYATRARYAFFHVEKHFLFSAVRFGVMTPNTAHRTTLKKHRSANSRPVLSAKALYV